MRYVSRPPQPAQPASGQTHPTHTAASPRANASESNALALRNRSASRHIPAAGCRAPSVPKLARCFHYAPPDLLASSHSPAAPDPRYCSPDRTQTVHASPAQSPRSIARPGHTGNPSPPSGCPQSASTARRHRIDTGACSTRPAPCRAGCSAARSARPGRTSGSARPGSTTSASLRDADHRAPVAARANAQSLSTLTSR